MKTVSQMEQMATVAKNAAGWQEDGSYRAVEADTSLVGSDDAKAISDRDYAEGVEAGILWALGHAGEPFPR